MRRRDFVVIAGGAAILPAMLPLAARAQQAGKVYRIGFLASAPPTNPNFGSLPELYQRLADYGFFVGQNLLVVPRFSEGRDDRFTEFVAEIVAMKVDTIVTLGSAATLAAKRATSTIPIVMSDVSSPEQLGLVATLARPGGNVTGVSNMLSEIGGKIGEITREALPDRPRLAIFWNPDNPASATSIRNAPRLTALGQQPITIAVRSRAEIDAAFERVVRERAQVISAHGAMWPHRHRILALAARHRLPVIGVSRDWARSGAILSYGPDNRDTPRLVANYVAKILNGASPAEMPVQQPTKFELVVNLKTAKRLNITIPEAILVQADEVIE